MTRFVYIADTHLGASPAGYFQQKPYYEKLREILAALDAWIRQDGNIDFVIHGGDMVDAPNENSIRRASELFKLSAPVYFGIGNHDMGVAGAPELWLRCAPELFRENKLDFSLWRDDCAIHMVPTQWCDTAYFWNNELLEHFLPEQVRALEADLAKSPGLPHILVTHGPVLGLPTDQTGFDASYHPPCEPFTGSVLGIAERNRNLVCVLSAHTHCNMHVKAGRTHYITVSAFPESPFEFKLIEVGDGALTMKTLNLVSSLSFRAEYDFTHTFVQGREKDRGFEEKV
jgi:3',5'-cyclic AMP phosphodiesterase CpdA